MKPVWIKYYGVIPMTRFGYFVAFGIAGLCAVVFLLAAAAMGSLPPISTLWQPDPNVVNHGVGGWFYNHLYWILLFCFAAQLVDTILTLRAFSQKEAEETKRMVESFDHQNHNLENARPRSEKTGIEKHD